MNCGDVDVDVKFGNEADMLQVECTNSGLFATEGTSSCACSLHRRREGWREPEERGQKGRDRETERGTRMWGRERKLDRCELS